MKVLTSTESFTSISTSYLWDVKVTCSLRISPIISKVIDKEEEESRDVLLLMLMLMLKLE